MDVLLSGPSLMTFSRLNLLLQTPAIITMTIAILASPIITILAPSLKTREASTAIRTLTVPTLNTTTDAVQNDLYLSEFVSSLCYDSFNSSQPHPALEPVHMAASPTCGKKQHSPRCSPALPLAGRFLTTARPSAHTTSPTLRPPSAAPTCSPIKSPTMSRLSTAS